MNDLDMMIAATHDETVSPDRGGALNPVCACGTDGIVERLDMETVPYGDRGESFQVEVPVIHCTTCGMGFTDQRAERIRDEAFRHLSKDVPTMNPDQDPVGSAS